MEIIDFLRDMVKKHPNDYDLGEAIRSYVVNHKNDDRATKIKERITWLTTELTHEGYLDGYAIKGFREELSSLVNELESYVK
tara:strand:- start:586 stop:831 length:246 start_codon:yes stop_codon:yes gene_type:complete